MKILATGVCPPIRVRVKSSSITTQALAELPKFARAGEIRDLGCNWSPDKSRAWEDELRAEMLHDR